MNIKALNNYLPPIKTQKGICAQDKPVNYSPKTPISFEGAMALRAVSLIDIKPATTVVTANDLYTKIKNQSENLDAKDVEAIFKNIKTELEAKKIKASDEEIKQICIS